MTDKNGYDYETLIAMQNANLHLWATKLIISVNIPVANYVRSMNRMAPTPNDKHVVFRGQDIIAIIVAWPHYEKAGFPPAPKAGEDFI
jgi:hypothetical protein